MCEGYKIIKQRVVVHVLFVLVYEIKKRQLHSFSRGLIKGHRVLFYEQIQKKKVFRVQPDIARVTCHEGTLFWTYRVYLI